MDKAKLLLFIELIFFCFRSNYLLKLQELYVKLFIFFWQIYNKAFSVPQILAERVILYDFRQQHVVVPSLPQISAEAKLALSMVI
ncbi:MAG: hypothetical protein LBE12_08700 [Planctomycetaceae bacterium]|nr:hypothetical protein [Planctomycetaceae bacterium]